MCLTTMLCRRVYHLALSVQASQLSLSSSSLRNHTLPLQLPRESKSPLLGNSEILWQHTALRVRNLAKPVSISVVLRISRTDLGSLVFLVCQAPFIFISSPTRQHSTNLAISTRVENSSTPVSQLSLCPPVSYDWFYFSDESQKGDYILHQDHRHQSYF